MEEMASIWCYQETMDEMREKLLFVNLELEQLKAEKNDEMRKHKEYVKQLIQLLNIACQERDEAKDQLHKLVNKLDSEPFVKSTKANSSITESETYNYHNSPKIESFFNSVSSPEFSNNMADSNAQPYYSVSLDLSCADSSLLMSHSCQILQKYANFGESKTHPLTYLKSPSNIALDRNTKCLRAQLDSKHSLVIDNFIKGKTLPQQGKLLQAVVEAGPLLQTLLISGQLPQWRNPPPFNVPPVSIKGCESDFTNENLDSSYLSHSDSRSLQNSCNFDMLSTSSMLNFSTNFESCSCLKNQSLKSSDLNSFVLGKRQRLH